MEEMIHLFTPDVFLDPLKVQVIERVSDLMRPRGGLIVVALNPRTNKYLYWERPVFVGFDETRAEYPDLYRTIKNAKRVADKAKLDFPELMEPEVALWTHPDAYMKPLDKYVKMVQGYLLPGCPTQ